MRARDDLCSVPDHRFSNLLRTVAKYKIYCALMRSKFGTLDSPLPMTRLLQAVPHLLSWTEAKGVTAFDTSQITSKVARLLQLQTAMAPAGAPAFDPAAVHATRDWLEPIVLLMSPDISKPTSANCALFAEELAKVGFWPKSGSDRSLVWMNLKGFFSDLGESPNSLRITTSYSTGDRATNLATRSNTPYDHWRIERRTFAKKKE